MKLLLDTHALLWWLDGDERLSAVARGGIADQDASVLVSAASAWEIATKVRIGKLPGAVEVAERFVEVVREFLSRTPDRQDCSPEITAIPSIACSSPNPNWRVSSWSAMSVCSIATEFDDFGTVC